MTALGRRRGLRRDEPREGHLGQQIRGRERNIAEHPFTLHSSLGMRRME